MVGTTLADIREHLETLSDPAGPYYLVCARTGERPFPADGLRFLDRETAVEAAEAARAYRAELRQWDRRLPPRDFVVCEDPYLPADGGLTDFCHEVVGAAFEALSVRGHDDIEGAVMDTYLVAAERVADRDRLCLLLLDCLTERVATLPAKERTAVLRATAERLSTPSRTDDPLTSTLNRFVRLGLVDGYDCRDHGSGHRVRLDGYELGEGSELPTLPFAVEYVRRDPESTPSIHSVETTGESWRFSVDTDSKELYGLVRAPAE